jgi:hypothetical protein
MSIPDKVINRIREQVGRFKVDRRIIRMAGKVSARTHPSPTIQPVIFFNASTRLVGMSLNASFSLLTAWALRLQQVPVIHFVCQAGMSRCVLSTHSGDHLKHPPCRSCVAQSRVLYSGAMVVPFAYQEDERLKASLAGLTLKKLMKVEYEPSFQPRQISGLKDAIPLGQLVQPSMCWALRRYNMPDDESTRQLYRQCILSAASIAQRFLILLDQANPQAVILFNGQFFPEATARWLSIRRGIRTITHEVGMQPSSAFFTTGEATSYPLAVPEAYELSEAQEGRLDAYLNRRFQGQFSMAGVQFWPDIKGLDPAFLEKAAKFKQIVPVFTNVIFDTSQPHSNVVFTHMFAWLDVVLDLVRAHPETLFVIRAHPDECRPGKASQESVRQWVDRNQAETLPNLVFVDSNQPLSSYELIQRSKFVMVYNSTIGLEASIMGAAVLCAGRARYTQLPTVFFPSTPQEFQSQAEAFLETEHIIIPTDFRRNARRFLYYQLFYSSLPFGDYIQPDFMQGFVSLREFTLDQLSPSTSPAIRVLVDGILHDKAFLLDDRDQP